MKKPIITNALIIINVFVFLLQCISEEVTSNYAANHKGINDYLNESKVIYGSVTSADGNFKVTGVDYQGDSCTINILRTAEGIGTDNISYLDIIVPLKYEVSDIKLNIEG